MPKVSGELPVSYRLHVEELEKACARVQAENIEQGERIAQLEAALRAIARVPAAEAASFDADGHARAVKIARAALEGEK